MKRYNDEELHALQLTSDIRTGSTGGLHAQNIILIELLMRVNEKMEKFK
jgi:hypothetical protein